MMRPIYIDDFDLKEALSKPSESSNAIFIDAVRTLLKEGRTKVVVERRFKNAPNETAYEIGSLDEWEKLASGTA